MSFLRAHRTAATVIAFVLAYVVVKVLSILPLVNGAPL